MNVQMTSGTAGKRRACSTVRNDMIQQKNTEKERIRMGQLIICLLLFLIVFLGKGVFPQRLARTCDTLQTLLSFDVDPHVLFSDLQAVMSPKTELVIPFSRFYDDLFEASEEIQEPVSSLQLPVLNNLFVEEQAFLCGAPNHVSAISHYFHAEESKTWIAQIYTEETSPTEEPASVAAAGTVLLKVDYDGQPLPDHYTMDMVSLGELETVTPVRGNINSGFGYRDHPVNGKYLFHGGVDIGGQIGDPIRAFSAGTVEYVGEDKSYGLYLQLDHGNGVKSFYAHCNSICVKKGQQVAVGETIGAVGKSGTATGPHLHLEIKYQKLHLDPSYYIDTVSNL